MDAIIGFFTNILAAVLPSLFKKKEPSEWSKNYEKLRFDVAKALDLYSRCYCYPVDLATRPDRKLPQEYVTASEELRMLGSTASALAATIPVREKNLPICKSALMTVSRNLIGLSNSMTTPYNCGPSREDREFVDASEEEIRKLLCIEIERPLRRSSRGTE